MRVKETGSDKWVAKLKVSGYSSNSDDASHFNSIEEWEKLKAEDSRYKVGIFSLV